jgi:hypothetical protein
LPAIEVMSDELETGLWAKYVLEQHSHREIPLLGWRVTDESFDYVGNTIYERLNQLNITDKAGLPSRDPYATAGDVRKVGPYIQTSINKLVAWAKAHKVRDFVTLRYPTRPR